MKGHLPWNCTTGSPRSTRWLVTMVWHVWSHSEGQSQRRRRRWKAEGGGEMGGHALAEYYLLPLRLGTRSLRLGRRRGARLTYGRLRLAWATVLLPAHLRA